jgi:hypothetical protein
MNRRRRVLVAAGLLAPAAVIGCSIVYPYGDVKETSQVGPEGGGGGDDARVPGDDQSSPPSDGGTPGVDAPVDTGSSAPEAEAGPFPQAGAVVISGVGKGADGGLAYVLSVLDPASGKELSRENIPIVGISYDGPRDLWYLFETLNPGPVFTLGPYPPANTDGVMLHVRQLETHTGTWTELANVPVPTIVSADDVASLASRLAYVAWSAPDAGNGVRLVVVDTADASAPSTDPQDPSASITPLSFSPTAVVGTRPTLTGAQGGVVTLLQNTSLGGGGEFQFVTTKVQASSVTVGTTAVVIGPSSSMFTTLGAGSYVTGSTNVFALPPADDAGAMLVQYDPSMGTRTAAASIPFGATSVRLRPLGVAECTGTVFVAQLTGTTLFAVPLAAGGTPTSFDISHSVSNVRFEPYTNTAIAAFNGGAGYELTARTLGGTPMAPTLSQRTPLAAKNPWAPPDDLRPTLISVRQPVPFACP